MFNASKYSRIERKSAPVNTIKDDFKVIDGEIHPSKNISSLQKLYQDLIKETHLRRQRLERFIPYELKDHTHIKLWIYLF